jgi:hypothetical protein
MLYLDLARSIAGAAPQAAAPATEGKLVEDKQLTGDDEPVATDRAAKVPWFA